MLFGLAAMIMLLLFRIISLQNNLLYIICNDLSVSVEFKKKNWKHCRVPLQTYFFLKNSNETYLKYIYIFFYFIFKLYNIVLVLPNIEMNLPQVYMCSPSWTFLPPPSLYHPSGSSQCTSPKHPLSCIEPGLATRFIYDIICISMPFSQIIPPSPSPIESKRLKSQCHYSIFPF